VRPKTVFSIGFGFIIPPSLLTLTFQQAAHYLALGRALIDCIGKCG
jgi:hypothetical protein